MSLEKNIDSDNSEEENDIKTAEEDTSDRENMLITDEVIAIIAGVAASEVKGVAGMSGGIAGGIAEVLGRKNPAKGVKVEMLNEEAVIDLFVILQYGHRIPEIAWEIQEKVKSTVESLTSIVVSSVNIHVQGIDFEYTEEDKDKVAEETVAAEDADDNGREEEK